jgi:dienelactone hydrolase
MKSSFLTIALSLVFQCGVLARDSRLDPPKDLHGYFPFNPPSALKEWQERKSSLRRQILVSQGLWPMPSKTPLNAVIHGRIEADTYSVEKVFFESSPGFFVTGNLYRPKQVSGKVPGILFAHGHWQDARLSILPDEKVRHEISIGAERFENGGKSVFQSLCVQLARMGCVVWQWDMISDSDSIQIPRSVVHSFAKQRPEMNTLEDWGFYSAQAESHLQSIMGLQTWNAVRSLDFLLTLPEVDSDRIAMTGASGGATQTMLLAAIDDRVKLSFPCVMVSTAMQGGCTCENASLLRINTGNVEFAALFAPKPQGMNTANDWTKELAVKGFPELQKLYGLHNAADKVFLLRGEHFLHNYNAVTRSAFYTFVDKHFQLRGTAPVIERDFNPLPRESLSVWDAAHPAPKAADPQFERELLRWFTRDAQNQIASAASAKDGIESTLRPALKTIIGRDYNEVGAMDWILSAKIDKGKYSEITGTLVNRKHQEEVALLWLAPKHWNGTATLWLDDCGKSAAHDPAALRLVESGVAVFGADLLRQSPTPVTQTPVVANLREFAGYTHGYNHSLFAQRTHDVLSIIGYLRNSSPNTIPTPSRVLVAAWGSTGPIALCARVIAGVAIDKLAVDTNGFRFAKILDYRDPMFLPGGAKYLDLPGIISLNAPYPTWIAGEGRNPNTLGADFRELTPFLGQHEAKSLSAAEWLLR